MRAMWTAPKPGIVGKKARVARDERRRQHALAQQRLQQIRDAQRRVASILLDSRPHRHAHPIQRAQVPFPGRLCNRHAGTLVWKRA